MSSTKRKSSTREVDVGIAKKARTLIASVETSSKLEKIAVSKRFYFPKTDFDDFERKLFNEIKFVKLPMVFSNPRFSKILCIPDSFSKCDLLESKGFLLTIEILNIGPDIFTFRIALLMKMDCSRLSVNDKTLKNLALLSECNTFPVLLSQDTLMNLNFLDKFEHKKISRVGMYSLSLESMETCSNLKLNSFCDDVERKGSLDNCVWTFESGNKVIPEYPCDFLKSDLIETQKKDFIVTGKRMCGKTFFLAFKYLLRAKLEGKKPTLFIADCGDQFSVFDHLRKSCDVEIFYVWNKQNIQELMELKTFPDRIVVSNHYLIENCKLKEYLLKQELFGRVIFDDRWGIKNLDCFVSRLKRLQCIICTSFWNFRHLLRCFQLLKLDLFQNHTPLFDVSRKGVSLNFIKLLASRIVYNVCAIDQMIPLISSYITLRDKTMLRKGFKKGSVSIIEPQAKLTKNYPFSHVIETGAHMRTQPHSKIKRFLVSCAYFESKFSFKRNEFIDLLWEFRSNTRRNENPYLKLLEPSKLMTLKTCEETECLICCRKNMLMVRNESCDHWLCYECIRETNWNSGQCPFCRKLFKKKFFKSSEDVKVDISKPVVNGDVKFAVE